MTTKKIIKCIFEIVVALIIIIAFFSLIFNWSWRFYPIGFTIGYALSVVIERLMKRLEIYEQCAKLGMEGCHD